jgi:signal peptidase II
MHKGGGVGMGRWSIFALVSLAGLLLDQATKLYVDKVMSLYQTIPVIDGLFNIFYIRNRGAAFSFLSEASWRIPFFISVSLLASIVIVIGVYKLRDDQRLAQVSMSMIFTGAVGNLIDRVRLGEVIDFLDVYWKTHHWPTFNIADSLICVGVALLALDMYREEQLQKQGRADNK